MLEALNVCLEIDAPPGSEEESLHLLREVHFQVLSSGQKRRLGLAPSQSRCARRHIRLGRRKACAL